MVERKEVIWTEGALEEKLHLLDYWIQHNKSAAFSIKLNQEIEDAVDFLAAHENAGIAIGDNVRKLTVREYLVFYEVSGKNIFILSIWDGRQDPEKLKKRLE